MIIFWIAAAALLCLALGLVLTPLLRTRSDANGVPTNGSNLTILRDQLRQIDDDLAAGMSTPAEHQASRAELERRVLEEEAAPEAGTPLKPTAAHRAPRTAWVVGLLVPALAVGAYVQLGTPAALSPQVVTAEEPFDAGQAAQLAELNGLVDKLGERMANEPGNLEGWTQLGRAYAMLQRYEEAKNANRHAMGLGAPTAQLLADQADVLAMLQGQSTQGEPDRLIQQALQLDGRNVKALALAGSAATERRDFESAIRHWTQALQLAPAGSTLANNLESSLAEARSAAQAQATPAPATPSTSGGAGASGVGSAAPVAGTRTVSGTVRLAPELAARVAAGDTLFIYARAAQGPRMPLAIVRATAASLPFSFTLDDSTAMSPQTRLSQFDSVVVSARISKSGEALPSRGDLVGQIGPLSLPSQELQITIDDVQP